MPHLTEDITLKRNPNDSFDIETNVPHVWKYHSPTGFEFGYGGSGPADLALNILLKSGLDREEAWLLHQDFKWKFIANMPREGGTIKKEEVIDWIESNSPNTKEEKC